ncbi:MAG: SDR family NAD(P)-dependent oxidoreductase [Paludibacteraceae bacterium]|nr:SDR family NAD(P)-dependent oxidoreductase [Paludibacteraceae bacterium]
MQPKVILITGASSGMGYQTARILAEQGHRVYGAARRVEKIEELAPYGVQALRLDITNEQSVTQVVQELIEREGRIDVLINNAGYGYFGAIEDVPISDAKHQFEVNIFGLARITQEVLPYMRAQKSGRIVNLASVAGHVTLAFGAWYNATKYALEAFSDALRMEVKPFGIDVVIIEPGAIRTDWGIIAADHLRDVSKGGAYEQDGSRVAEGLRRIYLSKIPTNPAVISRKIAKAAVCRCPRTRYRTGRGAKLMVFFHQILPTRLWDYLVVKSMTKM